MSSITENAKLRKPSIQSESLDMKGNSRLDLLLERDRKLIAVECKIKEQPDRMTGRIFKV